jgi:excisionase family DNA binding protein
MHRSVESPQAIRDVPHRGETPAVPGSPLVTQAHAAESSGLTRRQIAELVNSGHLASIEIGRRRLIPRWSLHRLLCELHGVAA